MASVNTRPNGHRWVTFKAPTGKRQTIRLGQATLQQANNFKQKIERLLVCLRLVEPLDAALMEFIAELPESIHDTLANCGVVSARGARTLGALTSWYTKRFQAHCLQGRRKPSTLKNVKRAVDVMDRYFGRDRSLRSFKSYLDTPDEEETDGEKFRAWLLRSGRHDGGPLAATTASSLCCRAKAIFDEAVARGWMRDNPFAEMRDWVTSNPERDEYIDLAQFELVAKEADPETSLFYSLSRYAGLRGVSELSPLEWSWVDWSHRTLFVKAPKTSRYAGKESRFVPLADVLYERLLAASERAPEGEVYIFGDTRITSTAWNNRLEQACRRAKVVLWQKPMINLRASCEYDWLRKHPIDMVAAWMGHSPDTMLKHYSRVAKQQSAQAAGSALHAPETPHARAC